MATSPLRPLLLALPVALSSTPGCSTHDVVALAGPACEAGTAETVWASACPTAPTKRCVSGAWTAAGSSSLQDVLVTESVHVAIYAAAGRISPADAATLASFFEEKVWPGLFGSPVFIEEPYCDLPEKYKVSVMVHDGVGTSGGALASGRMAVWLAPEGQRDSWGLAFAFVEALRTQQRGLSCGPGERDFCGWFHPASANFLVHQLKDNRANAHCTELLVNAPHLYLGSTRDRFCNWQFLEYLKDKHCFEAVNALWSALPASDDPFSKLRATRGWTVSQLNDFFGEWAMHNVTWDYVDPPPQVSPSFDPGAVFRQAYGAITDTKSQAYRTLRLTSLEPLDADVATTRRFATPSLWAPQRWGYNVVQLFPDSDSGEVTVTFRGVLGSGPSADWRWGLVATDAASKTPRYSPLQRGADGALRFCVNEGELLFLVVMATPSTQEHIFWDQPYDTIPRYPYMVQLEGAWPRGFRGGATEACPEALVSHVNGGGCVIPSLPATVYVGPSARVLGGSVSGDAVIDGHATVVAGTVTGGTVTGLSVIAGASVRGNARVETSFYPLGHFEGGQVVSGTAWLYGDVEYRGVGLERSSGAFTGFVDAASAPRVIADGTPPPPYQWRD